MTAQEFQRATGVAAFPAELDEWVKGDKFEYYSNNQVQYTMRGVHVKLDVLWDYEAPAGAGDTSFCVLPRHKGARGSAAGRCRTVPSGVVRDPGGRPERDPGRAGQAD